MSEIWNRFQRAELSKEAIQAIIAEGFEPPHAVYQNNLYEVWVRNNMNIGNEWPAITWLSIKRRDKEGVHDWRHLQRIKNELVGKENEAVELYPAESRCVDSANQYHLWVLTDSRFKFPFGYRNRLVLSPEAGDKITPGAKQRPFDDTHEAPDA